MLIEFSSATVISDECGETGTSVVWHLRIVISSVVNGIAQEWNVLAALALLTSIMTYTVYRNDKQTGHFSLV